MKKKTKNIVIWICVSTLVIPILLWGIVLIKNYALTEIYKDKINEMQFVEDEETISEFDWYRITLYSGEKIEIYFVNTVGKDTDYEYKVGGKMTFNKTPNGWHHTDMVDSILWSGAGSADNYIWPYWHHIFLA